MPYNPYTDWKTTKGNIAPDSHWSGTDDAAAAYAQLKAEVERNYSGAVVVGTSTRTYNCHAFVHASAHAWFNDIGPFLRDDYYLFTPGTLQLNDAVVYVKNGQITHSGFIIQLSGNSVARVRSKWGAYPVVEHPPNSVPDIYGSIVYYLRKRPEHAMAMTGEAPEISKLIDNVLNENRLRDLWLASTPQVAEEIVKGWPEFSALQLNGAAAADLIRDRLKEASGDKLFVLLVLAKHSTEHDLRSLAFNRMGADFSLSPKE
ncbi:hypothetical protein ABIB00_005446 [Bradyrhizobium sp. LB14.3]|uniref:DUF7689 domain-containing protein n=1 Tax=Bradyrhizobium sp. LB14.3 TaxID=3156328 RepID=UPI003394F676